MGEKVVLFADSVCDIGDALQQQYDVQFTYNHIALEGKDYIDTVEISPQQIYEAYWQRKALPQTSGINIAAFSEAWAPWVEKGYEIVHINLGSALSISYQNALLAAESIEGVYVIDGQNLSTGLGHLVIEAGRRIQQGMPAKQVYDEVCALRENVHSSFVVDTLEFLKAGGRCSALAAFGANLLNLKPCIEVSNKDGAMGVGKKYRGLLEKAFNQYVVDQLDKYSDIRTDKIFITHSGIDPSYIEQVREKVESKMKFDNIYVTQASCTISCHCGPNTLGILFMTA